MRSTLTIGTGIATVAVLILGGTTVAQAADSTTDIVVDVNPAGYLSITAPLTFDFGEANANSVAIGNISGVQVHDNRTSEFNWTASVGITDFTSATDTISVAGNFLYGTPTITEQSDIFDYNLNSSVGTGPTPVVTPVATWGEQRSVGWGAVLALQIPAGTPSGSYHATLTHSVL